MDIVSHTLTGIAVGTVAATVSNSSWKSKGLIILTGGLGGALPDLDAISLWSKFDSTIGSLLKLNHSGKEIYVGKFGTHHAAAFFDPPIILILLATAFNVLIRREFKVLYILERLSRKRFLILAFFFGFIFHLLEDMPTPVCMGGVNLFFPSSKYVEASTFVVE